MQEGKKHDKILALLEHDITKFYTFSRLGHSSRKIFVWLLPRPYVRL